MAFLPTQFIKASLRLKQKAVNFKSGRGLVLGDDVKKRIDEIFSHTASEFEVEAEHLIASLRADIAELAHDPDPSSRLTRIEDTAGELRGMGAMFDFPLITHLAKCLVDLAHGTEMLHPALVRILSLNTSAMACVLRNGSRGEGSRLEHDVISALQEAKTKIRDRHCIKHVRRISDAQERLESSKAANIPDPLQTPKWSRLQIAAMNAA